jgi:hypothetical protein
MFTSQRGSAIIMLLIAVALFAMVTYAFLQGSRGNVGMMTSEAAKVAGYTSQDCTNSFNMGMKRLKAHGCENMISMNPDGSNSNPGAPRDGSCSLYHPNGGGAKHCDLSTTPVAACTVATIGDICPDGSVYAGLSPDGNTRMYTTPNDGPNLPWNNGNSTGTVATGATNTITGYANTMMIVAMDADTDTPGVQPHQAFQYCVDLVAHSHDDWYMPSQAEIGVLGDSQEEIGGFNSGGVYPIGLYQGAWEDNDQYLPHMHFWGTSNGEYALTGGEAKAESHQVRCVRKDP